MKYIRDAVVINLTSSTTRKDYCKNYRKRKNSKKKINSLYHKRAWKLTKVRITQSSGAVEYTDCTSAEG